LGLAGCGGGGGPDALPSLAILNPTPDDSYATTSSGAIVGGSISRASFVHVVNTTTGFRTEGYVIYFDGQGTWSADVAGLVPGANVIVATADGDGTGARTASDTLSITRPIQPARLILNGDSAAQATSHWALESGHQIALYADGSGRATTGNAVTDPAGAPLAMTWSYDGAEAVVINGCPVCSFQRIGRISGSAADGGFYGQIETVGGAAETVVDFFELNAGSF
jgi:hypothetical protein